MLRSIVVVGFAISACTLAREPAASQQSIPGNAISNQPGRAANALFFEDFSGIAEGSAPTGWLGTEHFAVRRASRSSVFRCFERGVARFTIPGVLLTGDFQFEVVASQVTWSGYWGAKGVELQIGTLVFGIRDRGWESHAFVGQSGAQFPRPPNGAVVRFVLERRGDVFRLFVDGRELVLARYPATQLSESWVLQLNEGESIWCRDDNNPALMRIAVNPLS